MSLLEMESTLQINFVYLTLMFRINRRAVRATPALVY